MKFLALLFMSSLALAQSYDQPKVSCNAVPVSFVTMKHTTTGVETDMVVGVTAKDGLGESTIVASNTFVGLRYERVFPSIAKWLDNSTSLAGYNFKIGLSLTPGLVKTPTVLHWGERAGLFMKYSPQGSKSFSLGAEVQWNNFPGIVHDTLSLSVGPNFKW
jgi:hypothetical protein